jgi:hypothetical protein
MPVSGKTKLNPSANLLRLAAKEAHAEAVRVSALFRERRIDLDVTRRDFDREGLACHRPSDMNDEVGRSNRLQVIMRGAAACVGDRDSGRVGVG